MILVNDICKTFYLQSKRFFDGSFLSRNIPKTKCARLKLRERERERTYTHEIRTRDTIIKMLTHLCQECFYFVLEWFEWVTEPLQFGQYDVPYRALFSRAFSLSFREIVLVCIFVFLSLFFFVA